MSRLHVRGGLISSVLANWGAFGFSVAVAFFLSPFVVHSLGQSTYGVWVLLNSLVGYTALLDLGVRGAVQRYVARFHETGEHGRAGVLTSSALTAFGALSLVAVAASVLLALIVDRAFHLPGALVATARIVIIVSGLGVAVSLIDGVFGGVLVGLQRFDVAGGVDVAATALRAVSVVIALKLGAGLVGLALVQLGIPLLQVAVDLRLARRLYPALRFRLPSLDSEHLRLLFTFGLTSWVLQVSGQIMRYSDSIVIGALLPVGFVAYFAIAASLTEYARSMISSVSGVLTPLTTTLQARGDERALRDSLMASTRLTTMLVLPVAATFFLRGRSFIGLWMGPAYRDLSGRVLQILAIALAGQAAFHVVTATMIGINRHRGLIPVFALDAICNIALSIYLVRALGVVGSAIGTLVPQLVVTTVVAPWYVRRVMGIPMRQYWFNALLRPLAAIVPFVVGSYLVERLWATSRLPLFLAQVALTLPLAAAGAWLVAVTRDERRSIMSLFDGRGLTPARGTT